VMPPMCFRKFAQLPVITLIKIIDNISDIKTARIFIFLFLYNERSFSTEIFTEIKNHYRKTITILMNLLFTLLFWQVKTSVYLVRSHSWNWHWRSPLLNFSFITSRTFLIARGKKELVTRRLVSAELNVIQVVCTGRCPVNGKRCIISRWTRKNRCYKRNYHVHVSFPCYDEKSRFTRLAVVDC